MIIDIADSKGRCNWKTPYAIGDELGGYFTIKGVRADANFGHLTVIRIPSKSPGVSTGEDADSNAKRLYRFADH